MRESHPSFGVQGLFLRHAVPSGLTADARWDRRRQTYGVAQSLRRTKPTFSVSHTVSMNYLVRLTQRGLRIQA